MTPELAALSTLALLHFATVWTGQRLLTRDVGRRGNYGTREGIEERLSARTMRLRRAIANGTENLGPFIIAVVVVVLAAKASVWTAGLAWLYVGLRVLYVAAYVFAWVPWRSLIWFAGALTTVALLILGLV